MSTSPRAIRPGPAPVPPAGDTAADLGARVRALRAEAGALAAEEMASLIAGLREGVRRAGEVAEGGAVYPAGVRDLARRLADDVAAKARTLEILMARA